MGWSMFDVYCCCGDEPDPCENGLGYNLQFVEDFATDPPTYVTPVQNLLTTPATYDDSGGDAELQIQGASYVPPNARPKIEYFLEGPDCNIGDGTTVSTVVMETEFVADSAGAEERILSLVLKKNGGVFINRIEVGYDLETGTMSVNVIINSTTFSDSAAFTQITDGRIEATFTESSGDYELTVKLYNAADTEIDSWQWDGDGANGLIPGEQVVGCNFYFYLVGRIQFTSVDPGSRDYTLTFDNYSVDWS